MEYKDYYKIMGVSRDATADQIKQAYRKLARKYHPDVSKEVNAETKFKELGEAYAVLNDPQKRSQYDQLGSQWQAGQGFTPPPQWHTGGSEDFGTGTTGDFSDFFEAMFGKGNFRQQRTEREFNMRGKNLQSKILISLEEAYSGTTRALQVDGRMLNVKIPAGVSAGQQIRLAGQGNPGRGKGPSGDLYLEIELQPHPFYRLVGKDIYLNLPLTPWEAALGATLSVPTLGGKVELKIPPNSQTGKQLRLRERGMPGKIPGDQYIVLEIHTPLADTQNARELYEKMAQSMPFNPRKYMGV